jgi:DNA-binding beta-propeller fold protein YncE
VAAAASAPVAWVVNQSLHSAKKGSVTPIDTATHTAGRPIKTGADPFAVTMASTPNSKTVYVVNEEPYGTVTPIDTATSTARRAIRVAPRNGFDITTVITPDGRTVYVGGALAGTSPHGFIVPVSTATGRAGTPVMMIAAR